MDYTEAIEFIILNKEVLRKDLKEDVNRFLKNKRYFKGVFLLAFEKAFKNYVIKLLREKLTIDLSLDTECAIMISRDTIEELFGEYFYV